MRNKGIIFFLILLALVIVGMIVADYISSRPGRSKANPFDLNVNEFKTVDPSLVNYKEAKIFKIGFESPAAIKVSEDKIFVAGDNKLKIISTSGSLLDRKSVV